MRSLILLALAMLLCSCGALGQTNSTSFDELMSNALQSLVVDSSAKLESYRFSMEMQQKIDLVNLTSGDVQKLYTRSFGYGMANMTDRALKMSMVALTHAEGDEDNSSAMALEEYLVNDILYLKVDGNWTAMKVPGVADAWSQQNTMNQQLEMFNQSRLSLMGSEMVDGQDCYKVQALMDMGAVADQLSGEVASFVPMQSMNYSELFRNMSLDVNYWITKDSHLLKKTDVVEIFTVSPQSLGLNASGSGDQEMRIYAEVSMLFEGFNERVNIKLPAEAEKAQPLPMGLMASAEAVPVVQAGNETNLNETEMDETMLNEAALNETMINTTKQNETLLNETMQKISIAPATVAA
ncbi:MAG: hypothetical protein JW999_03400 [Methanotrichaceae archaeon]|nr:hypothetical protein [Methanotrichaceae archaeon]